MSQRLLVLSLLLPLTGCRPFEFNDSQKMTRDQMLARATHVFVGVIQEQKFDPWPYFGFFDRERECWRLLRRRIRVEMVLHGSEPHGLVDIYEIAWTCGTTGYPNLTEIGGRYLFPVRVESGRYHVVRDWWRSIFAVASGRHTRLPLDESKPLWERVALMMWWVQPDWISAFGYLRDTDPGQTLTKWRTAKLLRGLFRHPDRRLSLLACENLLHSYEVQDECWDAVPAEDRKLLSTFWNVEQPEYLWKRNRAWAGELSFRWNDAVKCSDRDPRCTDELRLLTTINDKGRRREYCSKFLGLFPGDKDNGCPADRVPPATMVTENGDVPLPGEWPTK